MIMFSTLLEQKRFEQGNLDANSDDLGVALCLSNESTLLRKGCVF
jgi:hypothetical protein